jgi:hypothetical protein
MDIPKCPSCPEYFTWDQLAQKSADVKKRRNTKKVLEMERNIGSDLLNHIKKNKTSLDYDLLNTSGTLSDQQTTEGAGPQEFVHTDILKNYVDDKYLELYVECVHAYLMKDKETTVNSAISQKEIMERIKNERKNFMQNHISKAINLTIKIALKKKLDSINSSNKKIVKSQADKSNRRCIISSCNGILNKTDSALCCILCDNKFCLKCEKLLAGTHTCKKEDIESIDFISSLVKCPKCSLPVQKSDGCNYMTCAVCNTHFDYITGQPTDVGNHGKNTDVRVQKTLLLSRVYADLYAQTILDLLDEIENMKPTVVPFDQIVKILVDIKKAQSPDEITGVIDEKAVKELKIKLAKQLGKYFSGKVVYKKYTNLIANIEKLHEEHKLDSEELEKMKHSLKLSLKNQ